MRQQLKSKFYSENIRLNGSDGNIIDGIIIPCNKQFEEIMKTKNENEKINENEKKTGKNLTKNLTILPEFPSSKLGTVLFCSPNAGLYECEYIVNMYIYVYSLLHLFMYLHICIYTYIQSYVYDRCIYLYIETYII
jgi:hypothetical protein